MNVEELLKQLNRDYATTAEAAALLTDATEKPVNVGHVRRLVKAKKLEAIDVAKKLYVSRKSIASLVASGWKPGDKGTRDREFRCYNVWLKRGEEDSEIATINKALAREVRIAPRKYYHKKKEK